MFINSVKRAREIREFHLAVVQQRLWNVQKSVMLVQSCFLANLNISGFFFWRSRYCRRRRCFISALLLPTRNLATMVTWRHTSPARQVARFWYPFSYRSLTRSVVRRLDCIVNNTLNMMTLFYPNFIRATDVRSKWRNLNNRCLPDVGQERVTNR